MEIQRFLKEYATPSLVQVISVAMSGAESSGRQTQLADLVKALLEEKSVADRIQPAILLKAKAAIAAHLSQVSSVLEMKKQISMAGVFTFDLNRLSEPAIQMARDMGAENVSPLALLAALLSVQDPRLNEASLVQEQLRNAGLNASTIMQGRRSDAMLSNDFTYKPLGFGTDYTAMARQGFWSQSPLVGMEKELRRLMMLISSGSDSVVVVGAPGVGKSAIVHGLAWHLAHGTPPLVPVELQSYTVVSVSTVNVLADTGGRGELEERLDKMLQFFRKNPTVIPFFDEIHTLLDTDDQASRSIATALKPLMVNGQFRCIGATTDKEYARFIANDEAMNSRFTRLLLPEPDEESTFRIVHGAISNIMNDRARDKGVTVQDEAVRTAVRLTNKYQRNDCQPRKTIRLLRNALAEKTYALMREEAETDTGLSEEDVIMTYSDLSGIALQELDESSEDFADQLGEQLSKRVHGQAEAVDAVVHWLGLQAKGWLDAQRPRGRFLFLGPPGVGKTELALALAEEVMRDRGSLVSRNMGEYKGEGARTRFMGSDPGYVGFGQVSTVYSEVMMRPYSIVVLDEFEKAHESLSDPLISMLDGRAADAQNRNVDFAQCIFVLTSNAIHESIGELSSEELLRRRLVELGGIWTAPLVDRIDRIVLFRPLSDDVLLKILDDMIARRRTHAARPLPDALDNPEERRIILNWATDGAGHASARRLERALLSWLSVIDRAETQVVDVEYQHQ